MEVTKFTEEGLPIISLENYLTVNGKEKVINAASEACRSNGCFFIEDHRIDWNLIENTFHDMNCFFHLPDVEKFQYRVKNVENYKGFIPFETQNVNAFMGHSGFANDPVEKFIFGTVLESVPSLENVYPNQPPTLRKNMEIYLKEFANLSETLMEICSSALSLPKNFIHEHCKYAEHELKVNYYPAVGCPKPNQDRLGEHTDVTVFTIVCPDDSQNCLMIKSKDGNWVYANGPPKTLFINLGDVISRWTNDKWVATPHKVVFPHIGTIVDRISIAFFVRMNNDAVIRCIPSCTTENEVEKYEPILFKDYIISKKSNLLMNVVNQ